MKKFENKVAVVTGGTSGIGLAVAEALAAEGANVVIFARSPAGISAALKVVGPQALGVAGSVERSDDLERLFAETKRRWGGIDILFANAAAVKLAPVHETSDALFQEIVNVNLKGTFDTLRLASPVLNPGAAIVVTTSWLHQVGFPGSGLVAMTKGGVRSLVRVAAAELAGRGIRVNAVSPGAIETPLWGKLGLPADVLKSAGEALTRDIPLGRWGRPDEVARAVLFLASADAAYVTGAELAIDGGLAQV